MKINFQLKPFFFYEHSRKKPWRLSGDKAVIDIKNGFLAIADGITRTKTKNSRQYPKEFRGPQTAEIFTQMSHFIFKDYNYKKNGMHDLLNTVNKEIRDFNISQGFSYNDENNYDMGECIGGCIVVQENILHYGILEDCYINVLRGSDLEDIVKMEHQIMKAFRAGTELDQNNPQKDFEEIWCNDLRNNPDIENKEGEKIGWGCFNGEVEAEAFWQTGTVQLQKGDIVWMFTDGILPILEKQEIIDFITQDADKKGIKSQRRLSEMITEFDQELAEQIDRAQNQEQVENLESIQKKLPKEKTLIQIKVE
jgi:serine/threonine protein phosphatase PrpC